MRAVVDTNVLVSGLLRPQGPPGAVVRQIIAQAIEPVVCQAIVAEYRAVLPRRRLRLRAGDIEELLGLIEAQALWVDIPQYEGRPPLPDPTDWPFIACAVAAGCPVITGNARDFPAGLGLQAMTARAWAEAQR
jgi:putative PIN family toxin of toxin-antitoxin system